MLVCLASSDFIMIEFPGNLPNVSKVLMKREGQT
jgi:hypothetical protein